ncbi:MAG: hypothetical protein D6819_04210 [Gammaproteobacteria bacterium]|nr:MAG: hypothetical protein D6819_04210 [Gammaproteobacteria bacterium]
MPGEQLFKLVAGLAEPPCSHKRSKAVDEQAGMGCVEGEGSVYGLQGLLMALQPEQGGASVDQCTCMGGLDREERVQGGEGLFKALEGEEGGRAVDQGTRMAGVDVQGCIAEGKGSFEKAVVDKELGDIAAESGIPRPEVA